MTMFTVHRDSAGDPLGELAPSLSRGSGQALEARIKAALAAFWRERRQKPAILVVHKSEAEAAREIIQRLSPRAKIEVRGCGGCLIPEVWLAPSEAGLGAVVAVTAGDMAPKSAGEADGDASCRVGFHSPPLALPGAAPAVVE